MKLRVAITQETPPGEWRYKDPETGRDFKHYVYQEILNQVKAHRRANNLPISLTLKEDIDDQMCQHVPPEWCEGINTKTRLSPITFEQAMQGTAILKDMVFHLLKGGSFVSQEEADKRARTCATCHVNSGIEGCSNCSMGKLRELVVSIIGERTTVAEGMLQACKICGCALKAKVWFPLEILQKHTTDKQNEQLPDWCWSKKN